MVGNIANHDRTINDVHGTWLRKTTNMHGQTQQRRPPFPEKNLPGLVGPSTCNQRVSGRQIFDLSGPRRGLLVQTFYCFQPNAHLFPLPTTLTNDSSVRRAEKLARYSETSAFASWAQCPRAQTLPLLRLLLQRGFRVWFTYPTWTIVYGTLGLWTHRKDQEEEEQNSLLAIHPPGIRRGRRGAIRRRARRGKGRRTGGGEEDVLEWGCWR